MTLCLADVNPVDRRNGYLLLVSIKAMRDSLANIVERVRDRTDAIAMTSDQIAFDNLDLSKFNDKQE